MFYSAKYQSPLGEILLASDGDNLIGLWFAGQKYFAASIAEKMIEKSDLPIFKKTTNWLDSYFAGENPNIFAIPLAPIGGNFRQTVWDILCKIPYGQTTTYGEIARKVAKCLGKSSMSSQAVGGAVGHNPASIIIPCHRVVGATGSLTGYAGGIERKIQLLKLEKADISKSQIRHNKDPK